MMERETSSMNFIASRVSTPEAGNKSHVDAGASEFKHRNVLRYFQLGSGGSLLSSAGRWSSWLRSATDDSGCSTINGSSLSCGLELETKANHMTDCVKRHTKLPPGAVTRSKAVQVLLKTHSCQQCPECGKWAIYVPKVSPLGRLRT